MKIDKTENNPGFYRDNHEDINDNLDKSFGDKKFVERHFKAFFGISGKDIDLITKEEIESFVRVAKFLAKRIINAQAQIIATDHK